MSVYVIVEHDNQQIKPCTYSAINAALQLAMPITAIVLGYQCESVAHDISKIKGISNVLYIDHEVYAHPLAERITAVISKLTQDASHVIVAASTFGKNLLPRLAAQQKVGQLSDVTAIVSNDTFKRPIYAGNAIETIRSLDTPIFLSIRPTAFSSIVETSLDRKPVEALSIISDNRQSVFVSQEHHCFDRPDLASADIVVSGGRGLKNKAGFERIIKIADRLGAAVGASRAAVDAGMAPNDYQVGQTGQIVAPKLYFAFGISGAIQHLAGMKESKVIVAINKDADAPIFQVADYGWVIDLEEAIPELEKALTELGY